MEHTPPAIVETAQQTGIDWTQNILTRGWDARQNPKHAHSVEYWREKGIETRPTGVYLVPATMSGVNLCQFSDGPCRNACITNPKKGFGRTFDSVKVSRMNRSQMLIEDAQRFYSRLADEIATERLWARRQGAVSLCRLNMASDIPFEAASLFWQVDLFGDLGTHPHWQALREVEFYDYTKWKSRVLGTLPPNYHLTFSRSASNHRDCLDVIDAKKNVAVVFSCGPQFSGSKRAYEQRLPEVWTPPGYGREIRVIDGDAHDFRCWDEPGVIVGLRMKGTEKEVTHAIRTGFAVYCGEGSSTRC